MNGVKSTEGQRRISQGTHGQHQPTLREGEDVVVDQCKERETAGQGTKHKSLVHQPKVLHTAILLHHDLQDRITCKSHETYKTRQLLDPLATLQNIIANLLPF